MYQNNKTVLFIVGFSLNMVNKVVFCRVVVILYTNIQFTFDLLWTLHLGVVQWIVCEG
jgi:hypothetical protein